MANIILTGLPGKMAIEMVKYLMDVMPFEHHIVPYSFVGNTSQEESINVQSNSRAIQTFWPIRPNEKEAMTNTVRREFRDIVAIDYAKGDGIKNAEFYSRNNIPFIMGTTPIDTKTIEEIVREHGNTAIIGPNMALPIVALQQFMQLFADQNQRAMQGYSLSIVESHQKGKDKTSGTAIAMIGYLNQLGIAFSKDQIEKIRDLPRQIQLGVPREYLDAHGWHAYTITANDKNNNSSLKLLEQKLKEFLRFSRALSGSMSSYSSGKSNGAFVKSPDGNLKIGCGSIGEQTLILSHDINGRGQYAEGTYKAIPFLEQKLREGARGKVFTMIDVLNSLN